MVQRGGSALVFGSLGSLGVLQYLGSGTVSRDVGKTLAILVCET